MNLNYPFNLKTSSIGNDEGSIDGFIDSNDLIMIDSNSKENYSSNISE